MAIVFASPKSAPLRGGRISKPSVTVKLNLAVLLELFLPEDEHIVFDAQIASRLRNAQPALGHQTQRFLLELTAGCLACVQLPSLSLVVSPSYSTVHYSGKNSNLLAFTCDTELVVLLGSTPTLAQPAPLDCM